MVTESAPEWRTLTWDLCSPMSLSCRWREKGRHAGTRAPRMTTTITVTQEMEGTIPHVKAPLLPKGFKDQNQTLNCFYKSMSHCSSWSIGTKIFFTLKMIPSLASFTHCNFHKQLFPQIACAVTWITAGKRGGHRCYKRIYLKKIVTTLKRHHIMLLLNAVNISAPSTAATWFCSLKCSHNKYSPCYKVVYLLLTTLKWQGSPLHLCWIHTLIH